MRNYSNIGCAHHLNHGRCEDLVLGGVGVHPTEFDVLLPKGIRHLSLPLIAEGIQRLLHFRERLDDLLNTQVTHTHAQGR